ncbi:ankyrin repeat-containing domain protein [Aspergillus arachidicola]|uniref:Ankyrin repeat-containing domain protein n=1 Tax=Aspergillus arachidicola TaxID=656916 RepID=A0A5N6YM71_9EURO|nr:ankyrin repeat-containing domain protein [Aspergillus arachidicola]
MASKAGRQPKLPPKGPKNSFPTSHEPETKLRAIIDLEIPWNAETNENLRDRLRTRIDQEDLMIQRMEGVDTLGNNKGLSLAKETRRRATFVTIARQRKKIRKGNQKVHQGDIVEDVKLYKDCARMDTNLFEEIYLIPHSEFDRIALNTQAIAALNKYATLHTAKFKKPEKIPEALQKAIDCLRNAKFPSSYIGRLEENYKQLLADIDTVHWEFAWNLTPLLTEVFDTVISRLAFLKLDLRSVKERRFLKGETASWFLYEKLKIGSVHLDGKSDKEKDSEELFSCRGYDLRKLASKLAIRYRGTETVYELLEWPHGLLYQHCLRNSVSVAAYSGDRALLASFLDKEADMDIYDDYLGTPLYAAVCSKSAAVVELFLDCKTNPNTEGASGPPLTLAVREGNREIVQLLTQHESLYVNAVNIKDYTALWWSCTLEHIEIARLLLKHKDVRVTCSPTGGDLCLTWHSVCGGNPQMVQLLLDHSDTGPDDCKHAGETLLWWASRYGHASVVKLLLERTDVDPNAHMDEGSTALWEAAVRGYSDTVRQFLQRQDLLPNILSYAGQHLFWQLYVEKTKMSYAFC